jgi:hypothetical protein
VVALSRQRNHATRSDTATLSATENDPVSRKPLSICGLRPQLDAQPCCNPAETVGATPVTGVDIAAMPKESGFDWGR